MAGRIPPRTFARSLAPLWIAAIGIGVSNMLFGGFERRSRGRRVGAPGPDPDHRRGGGEAGIALMLRILAIASVGAVFTLTTDPTRLADSLVQQARVTPRFAYGALAAYQAIPRFGEDLTTLRQARRVRGLRGSWHPGLLIGVLVLAIRHARPDGARDGCAGIRVGRRTFYRPIHWSWLDPAVGAGAIAVLGLALAVPA